LSLEAVQAENWAATLLDWARLEWNFALSSAVSAHRLVHFAGLHALVLALVAAILATLWSAEVLARVEFLFAFRESEFHTAIAAL
jgi:hypothetical protein